MRSNRFLLLSVFVVIGVASASDGPETTGRLKERFVLTDKEAFGIQPAELIAAPRIESASWAPNGRYVLATRERSPVQTGPTGRTTDRGIVLYEVKAKRTDEVWKQLPGDATVMEIEWMHGADAAMATFSFAPARAQGAEAAPARMGLLWIDCATGRAKQIAEVDGGTYISAEPCPLQPVGLLHRSVAYRQPVAANPQGGAVPSVDRTSVVQVIRNGGILGPVIQMPRDVLFVSTAWAQDARTAYMSGFRPNPMTKKRDRVLFSFDLKSGAFAQIERMPPDAVQLREGDQAVSGLPVITQVNKHELKTANATRKLSTLWLNSKTNTELPTAMVAADCEWGRLSPNADAVLYLSRGAAWVTPLQRMSRAEFDNLRKTAAMQDAKQVGLAVLMYTQDYDEVYPTGDDFANKLNPYAKDISIFQDFTYNQPATALKDVNAPADTIMGYVPGPGGRAIVYADGHVKWKPDM